MNLIHIKKHNLSIIVTLALFFFAGIVANAIAHDDEAVNPQVNGPTVREFPQARTGLTQQRQNRIINLAANISNRFDAVTLRLSSITARVESRITGMESEGFDMTSTKVHIIEAKASLAHAQELLSDIDTHIRDVTTSEKPKEMWGLVRKNFFDIHTAVTGTREHLRLAVAEMRKAVKTPVEEVVDEGVEDEETTDITTSDVVRE